MTAPSSASPPAAAAQVCLPRVPHGRRTQSPASVPSSAPSAWCRTSSLDSALLNAPYLFCTSDTSVWHSGQQSSCNSGFRDSSTGDLTAAGGTSFAAPIFAGMVAIINQAKNYTGGQGLVNPTLYSLASTPATYQSAFHDIISGGNTCLAGASYCSGGLTSTDYVPPPATIRPVASAR